MRTFASFLVLVPLAVVLLQAQTAEGGVKRVKLRPSQGASGGCQPSPSAPLLPEDLVQLQYVDDYFNDAGKLGVGGETASPLLPEWTSPDVAPDRRVFCSRTDEQILYELAYPLPTVEMANRGESGFPEKRIGFKNPPGAFNTGMCWFHTRLQRSMAYLARFNAPQAPKPKGKALDELIERLIRMDRVAEIPGYASIQEFTSANQKAIEKAFDVWSVREFANFNLLRRIGDSDKVAPQQLRNIMDSLYDRLIQRPEPVFARYRMGGTSAESHSLLIVGMTPLRKEAEPGNPLSGVSLKGYHLQVIDSNSPETTYDIYYEYGAKSLYHRMGNVVPNVMYDGDLVSIRGALRDYCGK